MNRLRRALGESSFSAVVFLIGATALGWPLVSVAARGGVTTFFTYLFVAWGLLILLMFVVSRACGRDDPR